MISIMSKHFLPEPFDRLGAAEKRCRTLTMGQTLFVQGEGTRGLFYLASGGMNLTRQTVSGHNVILHRVREGDTFAEASLFSSTYHCTAIASKDSRVVECLREAIDARLSVDGEFARHLASRFAMQIQASRRQVELLSIRSAEERTLMAMEDGLLNDEVSVFAELIGLAPETVYRMLKRLVAKGNIERTARGRYRIKPVANPLADER